MYIYNSNRLRRDTIDVVPTFHKIHTQIRVNICKYTTSLSSAIIGCGFVDLRLQGWCSLAHSSTVQSSTHKFTKDLAKDAGLKTAEVCEARRPAQNVHGPS